MPTVPPSSVRSPKRPFTAISSHPRRVQPSESKSLPRHKKVKIEPTSEESDETPPSQVESPPVPQQTASSLAVGESRDSSSDQSAAKWFTRVNENVLTSRGKGVKDEDESPFYIAHQSTYPPQSRLRSANGESFGHRAKDDTENDELRGVIDDLTVQNKLLKSLLREWQARTSPASSGPDRVIEVRTHGLPAEKKRELERLLKTFTTALSGDPPSQPSSTAPVDKSSTSLENVVFQGQKPGAEPNNTDSGYASMTQLGLNSGSQSGGLRLREPVSQSKKDSDIKSYLHDIPDSLFPQPSSSVSENTKMAMVVQRLEHLFTGKRAVPGEHSLPLQQQRISRSAAKADRREDQRLKRTSKEEGSREAQVLPHDSKINFDSLDHERDPTTQRPGNHSTSDVSSVEGAGPALDVFGTIEQRPTRPLDLDIHRAQVPADNVEYIRHLGLSWPRVEEDGGSREQPWMYLNLLVSMAQLHTLNVTPAFVRKAVKQQSTKFELSKDGHKIRWKGEAVGFGYTSSEVQGSPASATQRVAEDTGDDGGRQSGRSATSTLNEQASMSMSDDKLTKGIASNVSKLMHSTTSSSQYATAQASRTTQTKSSSAFDYKPIVYQGKKSLLRAKNSYLDSSSSMDDLSPDSGGLVNAFSRSSLGPAEGAREGFMTFFSNPYFCTDLSGDKSPTSIRGGVLRGGANVVGVDRPSPFEADTLRDPTACYFTCQPEHVPSSWTDQLAEISMETSSVKWSGEYETQPLELPVSGVGGVYPADNFALDVKVARTKLSSDRRQGTETSGVKNARPRYQYSVVGCEKLNLQPSRLPPPNYVFFTTSSSSGAGKGHGLSDGSSDDSSEAEESPAPAGFLWQWSSSSNDRQAGEDELSDASSELGVLAAARARITLPGTINETGRTMSGSLAATVGASWSAASQGAEVDVGRDADDTSSEMSVDG